MRRVAVDFDGTLVEERWPELGDWLPGAVDGLKKLARHYDEVVIFSCRLANMELDEVTPRENYDQIIAMNIMLEQAGVPYNVYLWTKDHKPAADFYIDNKAIRFNGDWEVTTAAVIGGGYSSNTDPGDETEGRIRTFETGATRDTDDGKLDYEGFLNPYVLHRYAVYMHKHRIQSDGTLRPSDNWQRGIPKDEYMKSAFRHFMDWWTAHRDENIDLDFMEDAICALLFNAMGYLRESMLEL